MGVMQDVEKSFIRTDLPVFNPGDTIRVSVRIKEGEKQRIQLFEGVVIKKHSGGTRATFTVRKISYGIGVERIFPLNSPNIHKIEVVNEGRVRRAKLYYLRELRGKAARIKEKRYVGKTEKEQVRHLFVSLVLIRPASLLFEAGLLFL